MAADETAISEGEIEARPGGFEPPRMGFKHRGPNGNRRVVPNEESHEVAREIVYARDVLGLSWDEVSDHVDQYLAKMYGRQPTPRWNRRSWKKPTCHRWYFRQKAVQASDGQTDDQVFRQCKTCDQSKPVTEFSLHDNGRRHYYRRTCRTCRATRTFRQREAGRREEVVRGFDEITKVLTKKSPDSPLTWAIFARQGKAADSPLVRKILKRLGELCGDSQTIARVWKEAFHRDLARRSERRVFRHLRTVCALLAAALQEERADINMIRGLTDKQLDRAIHQYLLENAPELFVEDHDA